MARRRGGTQPMPISETDVVQSGLRVVERSSLERLTVRAVAEELGVTAPAVHYHLRDTDGLVSRVVEAVAAQIDVAMDVDTPWIEQYIGMVTAMDRTFLRYPGTGVYALTVTRPSPAVGRLTDTALGILRKAGFNDGEARELFTATYLMFVGWLATRGLAEKGATHPALAAALGDRLGNDPTEPLDAALRRVLTAGPTTNGERP
ncbi:transcriptional regulator, TetR family [Rhodococcus rhodochrous J3]|uniref:TetR/AcrR family transcriptional regulator n=3 Tax=Rhodococcus rhodochrous TaxID=1829 RepID=A0AA46X0I4_RHORH|nr:TetR/AcrR family transcriptional regulator [Rhodococcus rhodochrous]MBF4476473.1 TetR/AcrR family transcriptional regulator [Rhodococcus rhodochrous]UZF47854.1 TetR/AcrR family transcriptional regulator [Rhodococcus rhodochrous]SMG57364.1 transcriptional regulator, TetR family [Rhodococcus rhodochrous J3]